MDFLAVMGMSVICPWKLCGPKLLKLLTGIGARGGKDERKGKSIEEDEIIKTVRQIRDIFREEEEVAGVGASTVEDN